jgi:DDE superfamily endonuclease
MQRIRRLAYAILDGTLIPIDRVADQKPYYSEKHKRHGVNVQVIADAAGRLIWVSPALPGSVHDLTAARTHHIIDALTSTEVMTFADKGYQGARGSVRTPFKRRRFRPKLSRRQKAVNRAHAKIRARGERAIATLKTWKILVKLRCCPPRDRDRAGHARPAPRRNQPLPRMKWLTQCRLRSGCGVTPELGQQPRLRSHHLRIPLAAFPPGQSYLVAARPAEVEHVVDAASGDLMHTQSPGWQR